jgi:hypothetical protein
MLEERRQLLALAEQDPLKALYVSAGRLEREYWPDQDFVAVYVPVGGEYTVLLNEALPTSNQQTALRALIRHHAEAHSPGRVHVFYCNRPRTCEECIARPAHPPDDYLRRVMRRHNYGA